MSERWIKLYEKIENSSIYHDSELVHLWIHLLIKAQKFESSFIWNGEEIVLKPGQLLTGRKQLSERTGINESKIQRALKKFEKCHMIEQQTTNKNRIITITNWHIHQDIEQLSNNKRTTTEQQLNTYKKERKKERKNKEYVEDSNEFRLALFLLNHIRKNKPDYKEPNLQSWSKDADLILRKDKRDLEEVKRLIKWVQSDEFEMANVLSLSKLRKRYDQLVLKMNKDVKKNTGASIIDRMNQESEKTRQNANEIL